MKQEEKNRKSRAHILEYAFAEFAEQGYPGASVNAICAAGGISAALDAQTVTPDQYFDAGLDQQADRHNQLCRQTFQTMLYGLIART